MFFTIFDFPLPQRREELVKELTDLICNVLHLCMSVRKTRTL